MTARTSDVLASALPDGVRLLYGADVVEQLVTHQAAKLAEAGYVLVHSAPDEATVERLARAVFGADGNWDLMHPKFQNAYYKGIRLVLAALAGTAAPHERDAEVSTDG